MPYVVDRQRALRLDDIVAIINVRERRTRSHVIQRDNSLYRTLTQPQTLLRRAGQPLTASIRHRGAHR